MPDGQSTAAGKRILSERRRDEGWDSAGRGKEGHVGDPLRRCERGHDDNRVLICSEIRFFFFSVSIFVRGER